MIAYLKHVQRRGGFHDDKFDDFQYLIRTWIELGTIVRGTGYINDIRGLWPSLRAPDTTTKKPSAELLHDLDWLMDAISYASGRSDETLLLPWRHAERSMLNLVYSYRNKLKLINPAKAREFLEFLTVWQQRRRL